MNPLPRAFRWYFPRKRESEKMRKLFFAGAFTIVFFGLTTPVLAKDKSLSTKPVQGLTEEDSLALAVAEDATPNAEWIFELRELVFAKNVDRTKVVFYDDGKRSLSFADDTINCALTFFPDTKNGTGSTGALITKKQKKGRQIYTLNDSASTGTALRAPFDPSSGRHTGRAVEDSVGYREIVRGGIFYLSNRR